MPALRGAQGTELQQCWGTGMASPRVHPIPRTMGLFAPEPSPGGPVWLVRSTAMHRALCCPWMAAALRADIFGVVSEEMEQIHCL